jgi:hypothetical protein
LALGQLAFTALAHGAPSVYRINCGGDKFADDSGRIWQADAYYQGGKAHDEWNDTYATQNKHLHLSWRYQDTLPMRYAFPVAAGKYKVRMHFSEHDTAVSDAGQRVFRILVNGNVLVDSLDVYKEVFGITALIKEFIVPSENDSIVISFTKLKYQPFVAGIEVYPETWKDDPYPTTPPYRLACGGLGFTDPDGNVWTPDGAYGDGGRDSHFAGNIAKTTNPILYLNERWDNNFSAGMTYAFPVPDDANYVVRLHFAETHAPAGRIGGRVFDILVNDTVAYPDMDIYAAAGFSTAFSIEFNAKRLADGTIHLGFASKTDAAKINGIEVFAGTAVVGVRKRVAEGSHAGGLTAYGMGSGRIFVQGRATGAGTMEIFGPDGTRVFSHRVGGTFSMTLPGFRPGAHLVRMRSGQGAQTRRFTVID